VFRPDELIEQANSSSEPATKLAFAMDRVRIISSRCKAKEQSLRPAVAASAAPSFFGSLD
jgi:hypothetical protein